MIAPEAGTCLQESIWRTRRLWSLWDMLGKYAWYFFILSEVLGRLHRQLGLPLPFVFTPQGALGLAGLGGLGSLGGALGGAGLLSPSTGANNSLALPIPAPPPSPAPNTLTQDEQKDISKNLGFVEHVCRELEMIGIIKDIERAKKAAALLFTDRSKMQFHIEHITERLIDELEEESFLDIPASKEKFYRKNDLFGAEVGKKFPKVSEEITNAGTAYATGLSTAAVFHLMRVMEHCVQRFGRKLKVPLDVKKESWAQIMDHVNNAVKAMRGGKNATAAQNRKKERYSLACSRLDHVRIVWRNDTMHPKATYDETQALDILTSVEAFLQSVVKLV